MGAIIAVIAEIFAIVLGVAQVLAALLGIKTPIVLKMITKICLTVLGALGGMALAVLIFYLLSLPKKSPAFGCIIYHASCQSLSLANVGRERITLLIFMLALGISVAWLGWVILKKIFH